MKVSSALQSQIFSKYLVSELLHELGRDTWEENYNVHDLKIEPWANGLWVKQAGLISYRDLAELLKEEAERKAEQLKVDKTSRGYLVSSMQDSNKNYLVQFSKAHGWRCDCMRYRCWNNRMKAELPQLYKALNEKVFCHHIVAAYNN